MERFEEQPIYHSLAEELAAGLEQELDALEALRAAIERQISALYRQERETIEATTSQTSQHVHTLEHLRKERDARLAALEAFAGDEAIRSLRDALPILETRIDDAPLIERLRTLGAAIPSAAESTRQACRQLAFSLQYALHLGHSIIEAVQGAGTPPPIQIYTAEGETRIPSNRRIMVNQVG